MRLELVRVEGEFKKMFKPRKKSVSNFERFAMEFIYAIAYHDVLGESGYNPQEVIDNCVWNGNELYNTTYQILSEEGEQSRMWLSDKGVLVLEVISEDFDKPNKLYHFL